jgi:hypothetical protein
MLITQHVLLYSLCEVVADATIVMLKREGVHKEAAHNIFREITPTFLRIYCESHEAIIRTKGPQSANKILYFRQPKFSRILSEVNH